MIFHRGWIRIGVTKNTTGLIDQGQTRARFMRQPLKSLAIEISDRQHRKHLAFLFEFAMQSLMVGFFRDLRCKDIHSRQGDHENTQHTHNNFEEDFGSQGSSLTSDGQISFYENYSKDCAAAPWTQDPAKQQQAQRRS